MSDFSYALRSLARSRALLAPIKPRLPTVLGVMPADFALPTGGGRSFEG